MENFITPHEDVTRFINRFITSANRRHKLKLHFKLFNQKLEVTTDTYIYEDIAIIIVFPNDYPRVKVSTYPIVQHNDCESWTEFAFVESLGHIHIFTPRTLSYNPSKPTKS